MISNLNHADVIPSHQVLSQNSALCGLSFLQKALGDSSLLSSARFGRTSECCFQDTGQSDRGTV